MPQPHLDDKSPSPRVPKTKAWLLAQGAIVLFVYPFCLLANIMSFAATPDKAAANDPLLQIASRAFLWGSTLYPVIYLLAAAVSVLLSSNQRPLAAHRVAQLSLVYLLAVLLCFVTWMVAE